MGAFGQALSRFGPGRLAAMGAVTLALVGFFAFVILRVSQPAMGTLFTDLTAADAGAITRELDARAVRYESRDDGSTILAPRADLPRIRMDLAAKSLPSGGGVGYEIFDKGDAFSATSFVQSINHLRALEGELARTIRTIGRVQAARVHLAIPERRLFERDREAPRASIVLRMRGELGPDQVQAIRHLVASAVQSLAPDRVSIVDERGRLLADGAGPGAGALTSAAADDKRAGLERRLRGQVEEIVAGIVGPGRARVQVAAELDLNRIESRSESFDPESRVVRSTQSRGETASTAGGDGQVSVGNELPGAREQAAGTSRDASSKNEEVVNYEISKTTRTEVVEGGRMKRLSVAVLVDGSYAKNGTGELAYQPRAPEDLERIATLVRTAIGFDKARGDQVEVVNLPFAEPPAALEPEPTNLLASLVSFSREDLLRLVELAVIALLTLLVLLVVVRPMVRRVIAPDGILASPALALAGAEPALAGGGAVGALGAAGPRAGELTDRSGERGHAGPDTAEIARLADLARANPREAAAVLRGWMSE